MSFDGHFIAFTSFYGAYISKDYGQSFEKVLNLYCLDCSITSTENEFEFAAFSSQSAIHTLALSNLQTSLHTSKYLQLSNPYKLPVPGIIKLSMLQIINAKLLKVEFKEFAVCESSPASGTFVSSDSKTVTVTNGIITSINW